MSDWLCILYPTRTLMSRSSPFYRHLLCAGKATVPMKSLVVDHLWSGCVPPPVPAPRVRGADLRDSRLEQRNDAVPQRRAQVGNAL